MNGLNIKTKISILVFILCVFLVGFGGGRWYQNHLFKETLKTNILNSLSLLEGKDDRGSVAQKLLLEIEQNKLD